MRPHFWGPREVGGRYFCSYWRQEYTVTALTDEAVHVQWQDGRLGSHRTAWDPHDRLIARPR